MGQCCAGLGNSGWLGHGLPERDALDTQLSQGFRAAVLLLCPQADNIWKVHRTDTER